MNNTSPSNTRDCTQGNHFCRELRGHIELICGPMFSGKSTELLRRLKRHEIAGNKIMRIKFADIVATP